MKPAGFINDDIEHPFKGYAEGDEVKNFDLALRMLNGGRSDYFLGEVAALQNYSKRVAGMDLAKFEIVHFTSGQLFMSFPRTEKGARVRDIHDRGVEALGQLQVSEIYKKWGLAAPLLQR